MAMRQTSHRYVKIRLTQQEHMLLIDEQHKRRTAGETNVSLSSLCREALFTKQEVDDRDPHTGTITKVTYIATRVPDAQGMFTAVPMKAGDK